MDKGHAKGGKCDRKKSSKLGAEEAGDLTERIREGNYAENYLASHHDLSEDERLEYERIVEDGYEAREEIALRTIGLPYWLVSDRFRAPMGSDQFEEMVAYAAEILAEVICSGEYDSAKGSFSHFFAVVATNQLYQIYNSQLSLVKVPNDYARVKLGLQKACDSFYGENQREATLQEQAEMMPAVMAKLKKKSRRKGYGVEYVCFLYGIGQAAASIDESVGDGGCLLRDTIAAPERILNEGEYDQAFEELREIIEGGMACLSPRERNIISARYYISEEYRPTLEELALVFGVSKQRISQLEKAALKKLAELLGKSGAIDQVKSKTLCAEYGY